MPRRPACPVCGSRRWRRTHTGTLACREGHVLPANLESTAAEDGTFDYARIRRVQATAVRPRSSSLRNSRRTKYPRQHSHRLFLASLQIVLRAQAHALVARASFPPDFETVVKELWTVYLAYVSTDDAPTSSNPPSAPSSAPPSAPPSPSLSAADSLDSPPPSDFNSETPYATDASSNVASTTASSSPFSRVHRPRLRFTLVFLYLACLTLRLPVFLQDLRRLAENGVIPYLRARDLLPPGVFARLHTEHSIVFRARQVPPIVSAYRRGMNVDIYHFVNFYAQHNIHFPPLNVLPLLWRSISHLVLPPTAYKASLKLMARLKLQFSNEAPVIPSEARTRSSWFMPETAIVAIVVITAKMMWGFDGVTRIPRDSDDPLCHMPFVEDWVDSLSQLHQLNRKENITDTIISRVESKNVWELTNKEIDEYLQYCEENLYSSKKAIQTDHRRDDDFVRFLDEFFPRGKQKETEPREGQSNNDRGSVQEKSTTGLTYDEIAMNLYHRGFRPSPAGSEAYVTHGGQNYFISKAVLYASLKKGQQSVRGSDESASEEGGNMTLSDEDDENKATVSSVGVYRKVLQIVSSFVGMPMTDVTRVIYQLERKLL